MGKWARIMVKLINKVIILLSMLAVSACAQDPASIVKKEHHIKTTKSSSSKNPFVVRAKSGDTLYSISKKHGVSIRHLIEINRLRPPYKLQESQVVRLPQATFHVLKEGDTLYAISRSYGVDMGRLINLNSLKKPYNLVAGKRLKVPSTSFEAQKTYATSDPVTSGVDVRQVVAQDLGLLDDSPKKSAFILPNNARRDTSAPSPSLRSSTYLKPQLKPGSKYAKAKYQKASYNYKYGTASSRGFAWPANGKVISRFGPKKGGLYNDGINISAKRGSDINAASSGKVVYSGNELRGYGNLVLIKHDNGYLTAYAHADEVLVKKGERVEKGQVIGKIGSSGHVSSPQLHFSIRKGRKAIDPKKYLPRSIG